MEKQVFTFLEHLKKNNNREWFQEHKSAYEEAKASFDQLAETLHLALSQFDEFDVPHIFRIYRDVRFSKDKTPYKTNFSVIYKRQQPRNRGSFYVQIEPENSFIAGGFWRPEKEDLLRIRQAIAYEDSLQKLIDSLHAKDNGFVMSGEQLKRIPRDFSANHERENLLRYKQFLFKKDISDEMVLSKDFITFVAEAYQELQPIFQYLTEVLTTNANGELLYDE